MSVFAKIYDGKASEIRSDIWVASSFAEDADSESVKCSAIWDTGANGTSINISIAERLGLTAVSHVSVETANGKCDAPIYLIDVFLPNGRSVKRIEAMGTNLNICDALIGMDIITLGDMLITNAPNTKFEFRLPSRGAPSLK